MRHTENQCTCKRLGLLDFLCKCSVQMQRRCQRMTFLSFLRATCGASMRCSASLIRPIGSLFGPMLDVACQVLVSSTPTIAYLLIDGDALCACHAPKLMSRYC